MGWGWSVDAHATRWGNGLSTSDLRFNALSANPEANAKMVNAPLRSDMYNRYTGDQLLRDQLEDPSARNFMSYVVSCALKPEQSLSWTSRDGTPYTWQGELGLCPEWSGGSASSECQRWVSACVLSRNNAWNRRVLFSARGYLGYAPSVLTPAASVEADLFERYTTTRVPSTLACSGPTAGVARSCGFQPAKVGHCSRGSRVHVGGGGTPWDFSCPGPTLGHMVSGDMVFRVCEGLGACDGSRALAQSQGTCGGILPAVSFLCPASETFSVMTAPYYSTATGQVDIQSWNGSYPANEKEIFPIREGAFWGTIFGYDAVAPGVHVYVDANGIVHGKNPAPVVEGSIYPKMFSCQAPTWSDATAYATARLCTLPGQNCVAKPLGRCDATLTEYPYGTRCRLSEASGIGDYGKCVGSDGAISLEVITPYLNTPCDLVDSQACKTK
jgi:hypothetical protein